jgi:hypothetical protein
MTVVDYAVVLGALVLGLGGLALVLMRRLARQRAGTADLERRLQQLESALDAVVAGAGGQDRRAGHLDQRLHELQRRLEDLEENQRTARPYDEAIRLVRQGASAQRLTEELGLSRSEAELLIMLHGKGK